MPGQWMHCAVLLEAHFVREAVGLHWGSWEWNPTTKICQLSAAPSSSCVSQCFFLQDLWGMNARAGTGGNLNLKIALWALLALLGINNIVFLGQTPLICTSTCYLSNPRGKFAP